MNEQQIQQEQSSAKTLGIVALVAAFFIPLVSIICGHIAMGKYKKIAPNADGKGLAKAGLILGYVFFILGIIIMIAYFILIASVVGGAAASGGFESIQTQ